MLCKPQFISGGHFGTLPGIFISIISVQTMHAQARTLLSVWNASEVVPKPWGPTASRCPTHRLPVEASCSPQKTAMMTPSENIVFSRFIWANRPPIVRRTKANNICHHLPHKFETKYSRILKLLLRIFGSPLRFYTSKGGRCEDETQALDWSVGEMIDGHVRIDWTMRDLIPPVPQLAQN